MFRQTFRAPVMTGAGGESTEITIGELASHLLIKNHSAVELVDRLVKAGLVTRRPDDGDRRRIVVTITGKGEELLACISDANLGELAASGPLMTAFLSGLEARSGGR